MYPYNVLLFVSKTKVQKPLCSHGASTGTTTYSGPEVRRLKDGELLRDPGLNVGTNDIPIGRLGRYRGYSLINCIRY